MDMMAKRKRSLVPVGAAQIPVSDPPVMPGLVSSRRVVPSGIVRPPYANFLSGEPGPSLSSAVRTPKELEAMRRTCALAAEILIWTCEQVKVGVTTDAIDRFVHTKAIESGAYPSPLGYRGYPKSVCTSINEVICHGIPDSRPIADGDIINIDVTVYREGVHGDTSVTLMVGDVDDHSRRLVTQTRESLFKGIASVRAGAAVYEIGKVIQAHAEKQRLGVVREFIGHGVGTEFHSDPPIPHYYDRYASTPLAKGMTFTIEPMLTLGSPKSRMWNDGWTAVTIDGRRSAQFEHTMVCGTDEAEILTRTRSGESAHDIFTEPVG